MEQFSVLYVACVLTLIALCHIQVVPATEPREPCPAGKWRCNEYKCIDTKFRCNGVAQCDNGEDEMNCEQWTCPANRWRCNNKRCVALSRRCDGEDDCGDNSDEKDCGNVKIDCPVYVMEKSNLTCRCRARNVTEPYSISWPGHAKKATLKLRNVQRSDNGTQYTCRLTVNGVSEEVVYTLRVAHGPYEGKVKVGPSHLVKNGSQPVTLTCEAEDTYPTPHYQWGGVPCQKPSAENTCTFIADPSSDNGHTATCRAESVALNSDQHFDPSVTGTATGEVQMNIRFTPNCGEDFTANTTTQAFTSPGYYRGYPNNAYCVWHIRAPKGQWLYLEFPGLRLDMTGPRCRDDYVYVQDGQDDSERTLDEKFCERRWNPTRLMTTTGLITVKFITNSERSDSGFRAVFKTLPTCGGDVKIDRTPQNITSPGYPGNFPTNVRCVWHLTAPEGFRLKFTFNDFNIQHSWRRLCRWGSLAFVDVSGTNYTLGTYCDDMDSSRASKFSPFTSISNKVAMVFTSSFRYARKGFSVQVKATKNFQCPKTRTFQCDNFHCVSEESRCNGRDDCGDRSDEMNCE